MSGGPEGDVAATIRAAEAVFTRLIPDNGDPNQPIGVAVSGGGDSMALLSLLAEWAKDRSVVAATVDHGLRPESAAEAAEVARHCDSIGVAHQTLQADLTGTPGNLPAAARAARYRLLAGWACDQRCAAVLLGHTMDDVAETLLMRLARGSGIEGLAAMQPAWQADGVLWLRPLLDLRRAALRRVLEARSIVWVEDPTNEEPAYDRVKARQALAALAPIGISIDSLAKSAGHLRRQRRVLERAMRTLARTARRWGPFGEAWLEPDALAGDERDTALRLLADTLQRISGAPYRPRFTPLGDALDAVLGGTAALTLSGCVIRSGRTGAVICREPAACAGRVALTGHSVDWDRRWRITIDTIPGSDTFVGAIGEAGLSALTAMEDWTPPEDWATAPREVRLATPALWSADGPLLAAPLARFTAEIAETWGLDVKNIAANAD
ncbi:MAG: tRNA lysidine(34) synthetase TilS [Paracoccaceae bacterium]|nr:tRNA lysidine(34) synthetase TilS [Paracoccaceae bacterium]